MYIATTRARSFVASHRCAVLLLALVMLLPWQKAFAACYALNAVGTVNFSVPATITMRADAQVGDVLYRGSPTAPAPVTEVWCIGQTRYGVASQASPQPGVGTPIYPTSIAGVGFRLVSNGGAYLMPNGCCQVGPGTTNFNSPVTLELVKTGAISNGAQLSGGVIGRWMYDQIFGEASLQNFSLGSSVRFVSACQVNTRDIAVGLPKIRTTDLPNLDSTAGSTPFEIRLTCTSGSRLHVMLSATTVNGKPNVIASTGTAQGVGVQIMDGSTPVTFGATVPRTGTTPNGALSLPYVARYYRTAAVTGGTVVATATFTLTYD